MPKTALALLIVLLPGTAAAHLDGSDAGLLNGLMHPVFGLDHLIAMISVGVVSVQLGGANIWRLPLAFVTAMTAGVAVGFAEYPLPHIELGIAASVLVLGVGILVAHRGLPAWPILILVLLFGACHGYVHGLEVPKSVNPALYILGFVIGTAMLHIVGVVIGEVASLQRWLWRGLGLGGAVVAACGAMFVAQVLVS